MDDVTKLLLSATIPVLIVVYTTHRPLAKLKHELETLQKAKELGIDVSGHFDPMKRRLDNLVGPRSSVPLRVWVTLTISLLAVVLVVRKASLHGLDSFGLLDWFTGTTFVWTALVSLDQLRARVSGAHTWLRAVNHKPLSSPRDLVGSIKEVCQTTKMLRLYVKVRARRQLEQRDWAYIRSRWPAHYAAWKLNLGEAAPTSAPEPPVTPQSRPP